MVPSNNRTLFDTLVSNLLSTDQLFKSMDERSIDIPVNIYINKQSELIFEFAVLELPKEDINIGIQNNYLTVSCEPKKSDQINEYIVRKISKKAFKYAWVINGNYDLSKLKASKKDGILTLVIPVRESSKLLKVNID